MIVRRRTDADVPACVAVGLAVQEQDHYPVPSVREYRDFLVSADALDAWVVELDGEVAGHVALHDRTHPAAMEASSRAAALPAARLVVVARLLVAPTGRRRGAGRALLDTATAAAHALGRRPFLDVVTDHRAAIALYDEAGWDCAARCSVRLADGPEVDELIYLGPPPPGARDET